MQDLTGKVALITGGGGGLGAATAECLAEAGCRVVVADLQRDPAVGTARRLRDAGQDASALSIDVADQRQSRQGIERVVDHYGRLDVLVNNADTDATLSIEELEVEQWDRVMGVTLRGAFLMSKAAFPIMREQGGGAVVNICSTAAKRCWANASAHHASNWGRPHPGRRHHAAGPGQRRRDHPLRLVAAQRDRHPRGDGDPHEGELVAVSDRTRARLAT